MTVIEVRQTPEYEKWFASLKDRMARARVDIRIRRLDHGPGYRVYFARHGDHYVLLLFGGDKSTQARDIKQARALARKYAE